jgi:hypothetical protein
MNEGIIAQVESIAVKIRQLEADFYGEHRTGRQGLFQEVTNLKMEIEELLQVVEKQEHAATLDRDNHERLGVQVKRYGYILVILFATIYILLLVVALIMVFI